MPATIHLSGPSEHTVQTDSSGHYEAMGLPPGEYNMSATVPVGFSICPGPSKVTVQDKGCAELDWHVTYEGQISGRVRSVDGQPVADLTLALEPKAPQRPGYDRKVFAITDLDGTYRFHHLSPGQYALSTRDAFALTGDTPISYPEHDCGRRVYRNRWVRPHARKTETNHARSGHNPGAGWLSCGSRPDAFCFSERQSWR